MVGRVADGSLNCLLFANSSLKIFSKQALPVELRSCTHQCMFDV